MFQFSEIKFRNIYQRRGNSGAAISHFMMDILCFCHIGFTFLSTLTANWLVPGLKMKTVISDVSNWPQWFSDSPVSTSGSLHKVVKWSQNYCWQTFALKAYRWIRKIWHLLAGHKYSLNPYSGKIKTCDKLLDPSPKYGNIEKSCIIFRIEEEADTCHYTQGLFLPPP